MQKRNLINGDLFDLGDNVITDITSSNGWKLKLVKFTLEIKHL